MDTVVHVQARGKSPHQREVTGGLHMSFVKDFLLTQDLNNAGKRLSLGIDLTGVAGTIHTRFATNYHKIPAARNWVDICLKTQR